MSIIDDQNTIAERDPEGMRIHLERFPAQLAEALRLGRESALHLDAGGISAVVAAGMGGSAIGGDLAAALLADSMNVPLSVVRSYSLPAFVGKDTLVYVSSYSGNTEETLSAFSEAVERGARVVCATTGGKLSELASEHGMDLITLPKGYPPRAALAFGLVPLLVVLARLGLAPEPDADVADAVANAENGVRRFGPGSGRADNLAKQIAEWLLGRTLAVYGSVPLTAAIAGRWCGQMAENAKLVAHRNELPEMNHNEIVGWSSSRPFGDSVGVVFLRDAGDHPRVAARIEISGKIMEDGGTETKVVSSFGRSPLARMLSLVQLGDYISLYLAVMRDIDPTPVAPIDRLKRALADSRDLS
ncbi:MAG: bifunctional phosphoglucose/phosphomannose isomerase, partial [Candidatus Eisenbacteria bacterium]|nr:bifunctional phosphoglucose/phosphomannose isomerase [Candidatus Eisenbacteria bacterium]